VPAGWINAESADDHRLGLAADIALHVLAKVLDDDLRLLRQVVLVQADEPRDGRFGLHGVIGRVVFDRLLDVPVGLVCQVAGQHIEDEAFLDRLPHCVQMKWLVLAHRGVESAASAAASPSGRWRSR
jgi:hypothetical protein